MLFRSRWLESFCNELNRRGIKLFVISPSRKVKNETSFEVVETASLPEHESGITNFASEAYSILKDRQGEYDLIISNSNWSYVFGGIKKTIATLHDGLEKAPDNWLVDNPNVYYRFVSESQYKRLCPNNLRSKSFWLYLGLDNKEYELFGKKDDYYLFVSSLHWNWEAKGIDIFLKLAKDNPQKNFKLYGIGDQKVENYLFKFGEIYKNFTFCGELIDEHRNEVFGRARAFCQLSRLKESFGTSVISALSKGTPVIGLDSAGATKELCGNFFPAKNRYSQIEELLYRDYNPVDIFNYGKNFSIGLEVDKFIERAKEILNG